MSVEPPARRMPPIWLLGLTTLCNGSFAGILLVTVPQVLAARGVSLPGITQITSIAMIPGIFAFALSPILDLHFSRRTYATALALIQAAATLCLFATMGDLPAMTCSAFVCNTCYYLFTPAVAGWFGTLIKAEDEARFGAWLAAGSVAGFGLMSALAITVYRSLSPPLAVAVIVLMPMVPLLVFPFVTAPVPPRRLSHAGFRRLAAELSSVLRQRETLRLMALFAAPAATFALTNTLGGLGRDFRASETFVGLVGGLGATLGGVSPRFVDRVRPLPLYVTIGVLGALFTASLVVPPRTPMLYGTAVIGENIFQAAAFAVVYALALLSTDRRNAFAATHFALMNAAVAAPLAYMQFIDGRAYAFGGLTCTVLVDASVSLFACLFMALLFRTKWKASLVSSAHTAIQLVEDRY